jgi:hypothetical protein
LRIWRNLLHRLHHLQCATNTESGVCRLPLILIGVMSTGRAFARRCFGSKKAAIAVIGDLVCSSEF